MPNLLKAFSRPSGQTTPPSRRPARRNAFRAGYERLESRQVMTVNFGSLASSIDGQLAKVQQTVDQAISGSTASLPIVGSLVNAAGVGTSMKSLQGSFDSAINSARAGLKSAVSALGPQAQAGAVQQAIAGALDAAGVQHDHVTVTGYDPASGNITIDLGLQKKLGVAQKFNFDLGLPSLPFKVTSTGDVTVTVGMEYDNLRFGLKNGGFFIDTSPANEMKVSVDAGVAQGASLAAVAGLFQVTATPLNPQTFGLHAGISYDVGGNSAPQMYGAANADMALTGSIKTDDAVGNFKFPDIAANLRMNWGLVGSASPTSDASLGSAPIVKFENVRVGLGDYLSNLLSPLTTALQTYLTYYKPYLELINFDIPGLNDVFKTAGLPEASILGIAKALVNTGLISDPIVQAVVRYSDFLSGLQGEFGDLVNPKVGSLLGGSGNAAITLGSFDLTGDGDLRSLPNAKDVTSGGALTSLIPHATQLIGTLQGQLDGLARQFPASASYIGGLKAAMDRLQTEVSLTYPFSDDPVNGAFAMLLGRDATLVQFKFNLPSILNVQLANLMNRFGAPVLGVSGGLPATASLDGNLNVDMYLSGGYDTHGLREMLGGQGDAAMLADGFFLDSSKPIFSANGQIGIAGGPRLGATTTVLGKTVGLAVGVEGRGDFDFDNLSVSFDDPNLDGDNRFRPFISDAGRNLFTAAGSVSGSLSFGAYAIVGPDRIDLGPQFHLDLGKFLDFSSYTNTNPFRPANAPTTSYSTVTYDFAAEQPGLANNGQHDYLYAYVIGDTVQIYDYDNSLSSTTLVKSIALHPKPGVTVGTILIKGSPDGTTFNIPADGRVKYFQVIGQGVGGASDTLALLPSNSAADYTTANIQGTGQYGLSEVDLADYKGGSAVDAETILYSHLNGLSLDMGFTRRDVVSITADSTIPVDLKLSPGNDAVTISTPAWTGNLSQEYTIHGNGGVDSVTFQKSLLSGDPLMSTDSYTVDGRHLVYQTTQTTPWVGGSSNMVGIALGHPLRFEVDYDGVENVDVYENVNENVNFNVTGTGAGMTVGLHGPVATGRDKLSVPSATYTVGSADHTLDGFAGTLKIDDRTTTGTLVLDDSAANPLATTEMTDSAMLGAAVSTDYVITVASITRTRNFSQSTSTGFTAWAFPFTLQFPTGVGAVKVLGGGGTNTFNVMTASAPVILVGGPGDDTFIRHHYGSFAPLTISGNGGNDTFLDDATDISDYHDASETSTHVLTENLTFDTTTAGHLHLVDQNDGVTYGSFFSVNPFHWTLSDDVAFDGVENVEVFGSKTSPNTFTMTGNTSANVTLTTGSNASGDSVTVTAPAPTSPRGALNITGQGPATIVLNTGTLDFPSLQIQDPDGTLTLDDSKSKAAHHYVLDQGSLTRDTTRFAIAAENLNLTGGSGNDAFDVKWSATVPNSTNSVTNLYGGGGDDTFTLAHDVTEGSVGLRRTLDGYFGNLTIDGGTGRNALVIDDSGSLHHPNTYNLASTAFTSGAVTTPGESYTRNGVPFLSSMNVGSVSLLASLSPSTIDVAGLPAATTLAITANPNASIVMGTAHNYLDPITSRRVNLGNWMGSILGDVAISSTGTGPSITIDDTGSNVGRRVTLASNASGDTITGYPGRITLTGFTPAKLDLLGGSGDDTYTLLGKVPGLRIDGGAGKDTLDYSNYLTDIAVNLLAGTATDIDRGIAGFENVIRPTKNK